MDLTLTPAEALEGCGKRCERIEEAIAWPHGTREEQVTQVTWEGGQYAVTLSKPGKEVFRPKNPNENDMTPRVSTSGVKSKPITFGEILGVIMDLHPSSGAGELLGALLVRAAFMADHQKDSKGSWRYHPSSEAIAIISTQMPSPYGVSVEAFLQYLDVLGWNEDVKYNTLRDKHGTRYVPDKGWKFGRENTLLTCANFVAAHLRLVSFPTLMDSVIRGRGICAISWQDAFRCFPALGPFNRLPRRPRLCPPRRPG